jgi:hypothetical protein
MTLRLPLPLPKACFEVSSLLTQPLSTNAGLSPQSLDPNELCLLALSDFFVKEHIVRSSLFLILYNLLNQWYFSGSPYHLCPLLT